MMQELLSPAVFLDRDGTLMREVEYCRDPALVEILPGVMEGLTALHTAGWPLIVVTNQSGIGRGWITREEYEAVHERLLSLLPEGIITATYYCPDHPETPTQRRKPAPGMLLEAAAEWNLDLTRSFFIGDKASDVECARQAGATGILVETGYGATEQRATETLVAEDFAAAVALVLKGQRTAL